jgi:hypothetical protein
MGEVVIHSRYLKHGMVLSLYLVILGKGLERNDQRRTPALFLLRNDCGTGRAISCINMLSLVGS